MVLLQQIPKKPLSFTIFPLTMSIICFLIENLVSLLNSDISTPYSQHNSHYISLESHKYLFVSFLTNIRSLLMGSYNPSFYFMGIMLSLKIMASLIQLSPKCLTKTNPIISPETQKQQKSILQANCLKKQKPIPSGSQNSNIKPLKFLLYFTFGYYLYQLSSRSILVGAQNTPHIQEHYHDDILFPLEQNTFNKNILEQIEKKERQSIINNLDSKQENFLLDRLPTITRTKGAATSFVVSKDGNKIFQILETPSSPLQYDLSGMDISDPLAIKYYPSIVFQPTRWTFINLLLSSDAKNLFLITWGELLIYNISHIHSAPKLVSTTRVPRGPDAKVKPAAVLYEEKNMLIIVNGNLHIFNISDIQNPTRESEKYIDAEPQVIAFVPEREMVLLGEKRGLQVFDISDPKNPIRKNRILGSEFIFSISVTRNQSIAIVGVLNNSITLAQRIEYIKIANATLSIFLVDLENIGSPKPYRSFFSIDQLKTCRVPTFIHDLAFYPDMKVTPDSKYAYWACDKDYGYFDIERQRISRFLAQRTVNSLALAKNSKILLKMDSNETNFYALYQNIEKDDSFIWKPVSISRLKIGDSPKILTSKNNRIIFFIDLSTLQIFNTLENSFSLISTINLETNPLSLVPSNNGKHLYMKIGEKTIHVYDISDITLPQKLGSVDFPITIDDDFIVFPEEQMIYATYRKGQNTTIIFADIRDLSNPIFGDVLIESKKRQFPGSAKLLLSPDSEHLLILSDKLIFLDITSLISGNARVRFDISGRKPDSVVFSPDGSLIFMIESNKNLNQKNLTAFSSSSGKLLLSFPLPELAGNLPLDVSINGEFLYLSTPEHLMEINVKNLEQPEISRLMKLSIKQFSLTGDDGFLYAVIGDYLEILDVRSKYALTSFKENFLLGASNSLGLQLLERNSQSKWDPIYKKHKFITANFYKVSIASDEDEPIFSYSVLPNWINFDKETAEITIESRLPTHLGTYKMATTGSFQLPTPSKLPSSLPFLYTSEQSESFIADLTDRGYLDEERFLTARYFPYKKLTLNAQYIQYESQVRYFLRNYATDQEFDFNVSSSLFLHRYPSLVSMETQSPHYSMARIVLPMVAMEDHNEIIGQFVQRTYSSSRSFLNQNQTDLTLDGTFININDALKEIIINIQEPYKKTSARIIINDNLNSPLEIEIDDVTEYFRINAKPIANPDKKRSVQSQVSRYSLVSAQSFSINLHPKTYLDVNERPLEYTLLSPELDWLEIRGLTLTGTPPKKLWSSQVTVTLMVSNEFKSEKVTFILDIGMSAVILMQYVILYFGYIFSGYKMLQNLPKFYNISAQKFYRYPKAYQISVNQEVTDEAITPIGFFGKEFKNAEFLLIFLKRHFVKDSENKRFVIKDFIAYFKDEQGQRLDRSKLITAINQAIESLTFVERHSVKYYIQIDNDHKDIIHQIILDKIILSEISLSSEKRTFTIFKKIKDRWIDIVEQGDPYFKVNKLKLNYVLQNIDSKVKNLRSSEFPKAQNDGLLDMTQSSVRSRYMSNSHHFEKPANMVEESLLESSVNIELKNINMELLELALQAYAFKSHHLNAQKEQMTIISKERKVGSSCVYKIKTLLRYHLQKLQFTNKEDLGFGLKYVFKKNVLHFCGTPEASMEYETLVVQILNKKEMIIREIYLFGAENDNHKREKIEQVQEQL